MDEGGVWHSRWFSSCLLGLILCSHVVLNLVYLRGENVPPTYDPAYHLLRTLDFADQLAGKEPTGPLRILRTSYYYPPLFYWTAAPFQLWLGPSSDAAVISLLIYLAAALIATYAIGRRLFSPAAGIVGALVLSLYPVVFGLSREFYPDLPLLAMVAVGFYALLVSDGFRNRRGAVFFGIATGLGLLTKWTYPFFVAGPVAYFVWQGLGRLDLVAGLRQLWHSERRNRVLAWYLIGAIGGTLTLFVWLRATERVGRSVPEHGLMALIFFHLFAGCAVCLAQSIRLALQHVPEIRRPVPEAPRIGRNFLLAAAIAAAIAGPWYLVNVREVAYRLIFAALRDAEARAMPGVFSLRSFIEYFIYLEGHQLHLLFFIIFIVAVGYHLYKRSRGGMLLLGTVAAAYFFLTVIRLKDPRFSVPYLPFVALLSSSFLVGAFRKRWVAVGLTAAVVVWGVFQMTVISFGDRWIWEEEERGLPEYKGWYLGGKAELIFFKKYGWGSDRHGQGNWRNEKVLMRMAERWGEAPYPAKVAVVANHPYFHHTGFEFLSRALGLPLEFFPALEVSEEEPADSMREILESDFIVAKEGGDPGPVFGVDPYKDILRSLHEENGQLALNFRDMLTDYLPDGSPVRVYRRDPHEAWSGRPELSFESLAVLESYSAWPVVLEATGEIRLEVTWHLHPDVFGVYRFFMHVYDLEGEYQLAIDDAFQPFRGIFDRDRPDLQGPVKTEHTIPLSRAGEEGLPTGQYSLAVGIWRPDTGTRLRIRQGKVEIGDIVHLNVPLRVENGTVSEAE